MLLEKPLFAADMCNQKISLNSDQVVKIGQHAKVTSLGRGFQNGSPMCIFDDVAFQGIIHDLKVAILFFEDLHDSKSLHITTDHIEWANHGINAVDHQILTQISLLSSPEEKIASDSSALEQLVRTIRQLCLIAMLIFNYTVSKPANRHRMTMLTGHLIQSLPTTYLSSKTTLKANIYPFENMILWILHIGAYAAIEVGSSESNIFVDLLRRFLSGNMQGYETWKDCETVLRDFLFVERVHGLSMRCIFDQARSSALGGTVELI